MTNPTADEIIAKLKQETRAAVDAAYRQGIADATPPERFEFSNGSLGASRDSEYEAETQAAATALRMAGVVGNLSNHPDMVAIRMRHGR